MIHSKSGTGQMQTRLTDIDVEPGYSTSQSFLLDDFYAPALSHSVSYDRAAGYFSSSLIAIAPLAYSSFVSRNGRMRLICSPHVSAIDAERLTLAIDASIPETDELMSDIAQLIDSDDLAHVLSRVMSGLLSSGILEVKFARPSSSTGLFHDKVGIFRDSEGNRLSFVGSANETASAWSGYGNHEQIETFCSWKNIEQDQRSARHGNDFEEMWLNLRAGLRVESAEKSSAIIREVVGEAELDVSLQDLRDVISQHRSSAYTVPLPIDTNRSTKRTLREHQRAVLQSWEQSGNRGLVRFATGGGKTLVGIEAVRRWIKPGRPALILVPSELLHGQWAEEIRSEGLNTPLILAGAGVPKADWLRVLTTATTDDSALGPRIVLSTYQTAVTPDFRAKIRDHENLLIVADEVHRMGAPDTRALFELNAGGRLGLSATPERYGDEEGTVAIQNYFGPNLEPEFSLRDAIASKTLVPYDYYLESVELTDNESEEWVTLSSAMAKEMAMNKGAQTDRFKTLARQRSRILKRAAAKAGLARRVLDLHYRSGDHWLIYCEGRQHLQEVRESLENGPWSLLEYHSGNSHLASEIFQHFQRGGVLLAIKCLDEGVDIPAIDSALILASTSNPREYVQRRGRILRRSEGKYSARLFDVVVLNNEKHLLAGIEASRAMEFAEGARNLSGRTKLEMLLLGTEQEAMIGQVTYEGIEFGGEDI